MKFVDNDIDIIWDPPLVIWALFDDYDSSYQKAITKNFNQMNKNNLLLFLLELKTQKILALLKLKIAFINKLIYH
uniref:Uncharacterized protein n=1 Tax=Mycoplasma feriruminatoris TaxID=1179777 RepID=A0A654IMP8_9MOLU|nr:hypothetical protein MF5582_00307 [Mycoplasma feriruminatoris]